MVIHFYPAVLFFVSISVSSLCLVVSGGVVNPSLHERSHSILLFSDCLVPACIDLYLLGEGENEIHLEFCKQPTLLFWGEESRRPGASPLPREDQICSLSAAVTEGCSGEDLISSLSTPPSEDWLEDWSFIHLFPLGESSPLSRKDLEGEGLFSLWDIDPLSSSHETPWYLQMSPQAQHLGSWIQRLSNRLWLA